MLCQKHTPRDCPFSATFQVDAPGWKTRYVCGKHVAIYRKLNDRYAQENLPPIGIKRIGG